MTGPRRQICWQRDPVKHVGLIDHGETDTTLFSRALVCTLTFSQI